jgi:hypothetical protein
LSGEAIQSLTCTGPLLAEPTRAWLLERHGLVLELFWLLKALDLMARRLSPFVIEASTKVIGIACLFIPLQLGVAEKARTPWFSTSWDCRQRPVLRLPFCDAPAAWW